MIFLTNILRNGKKLFRKRTFLDKIRIYVRGGAGGQGHPKYGGHGGQGGNVYVVGDEKATLKQLVRQNPKKRFIAEPGANSRARAIFGERGHSLMIPVPTGIVVRTDSGQVLGEVNAADDKVLVAKGGVGGGPFNNYLGRKGQAHSVTLDLKLIADIGLVGFPNAGKSTLLSALSRAAPKIASYPFTTIQPQIGTMVYSDGRQITVADLPGLIQGAHLNIGMGHSFLKHVERTSLLMFVVDINGFRLSANHELTNAVQNILLLNLELELYKEDLVTKPAILVLNKIDVGGSDSLTQDIISAVKDKDYLAKKYPDITPETLIKFDDIILISAKYRKNTDHLKQRLRDLLDLYADMENSKNDESAERRADSVKTHLKEHIGDKLV